MKKILKISLIVLFWIAIWYLLSFVHALIYNMDLANNLLLPYPHQVIVKLFKLLFTKSFYISTAASLIRIVISTLLAVAVGVLSAIICSKFDFLNDLLKPLLATIKSVPVTVFVFILYLLILDFTSMLITFLMVFPIVFSNVYEGLKSIDKDLLEVCNLYKLPLKKRFKALYLPTVMPYFVSALTSAVGLAWKAGIAAEALCPPDNSMGLHISFAKQNIENDELFAWSLTLVAVNLIFELFFKKAILSLSRKWIKCEVAK
jgi:NitT/TauT family transport system permease protein